MGSIVVIGGGVSGLASAHRLLELDPSLEVTVLEATERAGGILKTECVDGFVIEHGPDSIITDKPAAIQLAQRLGLQDRVVSTNPKSRGAYVVAHGELHRIPEGFTLLAPVKVGAFLKSPILSWRGKLRAGLDLVLPRGNDEDESLARFVGRRFGDELLERLAQPMVSGIYGAAAEVLSLKATMPRFLDMEASHRSVSYALWDRQRKAKGEQASGARYGLFINFDKGSEVLVEALRDKLGSRVKTGSPVTDIARLAGGFQIEVAGGRERLKADAVVLALPAPKAAALLSPHQKRAAELMTGIPYGSAATVTFAYRREQIKHPMDASGFVVPEVEGRAILASTWASRKWPGRAPDGHELIRVFLGGARRADVPTWSDAELIGCAQRELRALMGIEATPLLTRVGRYINAMPHYHIGHVHRVEQIEAAMSRVNGIELAGNAYRGVGIPDAIRAGEEAAQRALEGLGRDTTATSGHASM